MSTGDYDLLIRAGRLFCAATGLDGPGAVAVRGDWIVAAGPDVAGTAQETLDFPDDLLLPGLVDLHTHPGPADWKYGIDADQNMLARGSTTVLSQGDAGAVHVAAVRGGDHRAGPNAHPAGDQSRTPRRVSPRPVLSARRRRGRGRLRGGD